MENDDLLGAPEPEETVVESTETPVVPDADVSPQIDTGEAKSVADAIDLGLSEVEERRAGKKPEDKTEVEVEETPVQKSEREAAEKAALEGKNPDGTPKDAAKDEAAKVKAAVDDPIPPQVAEKTRDRMQTLINTVKDKDVQIAQHQQFVDQIAATGASPQEFTTMMSYMSAVHSDNPEHLKLARNLLMSELEGISLKLGEAAPGVDFLAKYPELQAQVERGEIRRDAAQEIALTRTRIAAAAAEKKQTTERTQTESAAKAEREGAQADLTTLGNELFARDGAEYQRRYAILEPALEALGMLPPKQWKAAFLAAYNKIPAVKPAAPVLPNGGAKAVVPAAPVKGQPLRPNKTPSGSSEAGPKSLFEAIDAALKNV